MALGLGSATPVAAQDLPFGLTEVRGGYGYTGVELWTLFQPYDGFQQFAAWDTASIELVFTPPDAEVLAFLGSPRIVLGGQISTLNRASMLYSGFNWRTNVFESPVFIEGTVGAAVTNSTLANALPPNRNAGCPALLYFSVAAGYQFDEHWSIMGTAYHASHSNLCNLINPSAKNDGLNAVGFKIGYKF